MEKYITLILFYITSLFLVWNLQTVSPEVTKNKTITLSKTEALEVQKKGYLKDKDLELGNIYYITPTIYSRKRTFIPFVVNKKEIKKLNSYYKYKKCNC